MDVSDIASLWLYFIVCRECLVLYRKNVNENSTLLIGVVE